MMTFSDLLLLLILLHMCLNVNILVIFILSILLFFIWYVFRGMNGSRDVPKKLSARAAWLLKLAALEPGSSSSPISSNNRTPKNKSPKVSDRKPPRSLFVSEKKRPSRIMELESLVSQLQYELEKAKLQVTVSETSKKQAKQDAEESRKQLQEVSSKLQETKNQVLEEETDKTGAFNHRSVSQGCDLKFGATSTAERDGLAVVVQEIRQLKLQMEVVASSEAHVKQAELRNSETHLLRGNLMDTLFLIKNFSNQLRDCEVTDVETKALATETLRQLENAKKAVEELKSDGTKAVESYKKMGVELEQTKSRMVWLGGLVTKLLANPGVLENHETLLKDYASSKLGESNEMKVEQLTAALDASGKKDQGVSVKASSRLRIQAELQSELKTAKSKINKLKAMLVAKETEVKFIQEEKDNINALLKKNQTDAKAKLEQKREVIEKLKADLMDKETQLQIVSDENEILKSDIHKRETDVQDALMKLEIAMEEADKSNQRAVKLTEELDATQASYSEMKTELMKLNVQSNQWRIAAEEANTMRSAGNNNNNQTNSPYSEDIGDEVQRRKPERSLRRLVFCGNT